ncbi:hypothetical protein [Corynebacterium accolens]|uniref:hypothetical protein n=1 Tax=Corynebacterium accolens TaxID=38284 RepID=UPI002542B2E8|nr:hypothetical protein [Corynebacterium accolens]MDK4336549.1 hypothetical protein [Corynebacterium accolens]
MRNIRERHELRFGIYIAQLFVKDFRLFGEWVAGRIHSLAWWQTKFRVFDKDSMPLENTRAFIPRSSARRRQVRCSSLISASHTMMNLPSWPNEKQSMTDQSAKSWESVKHKSWAAGLYLLGFSHPSSSAFCQATVLRNLLHTEIFSLSIPPTISRSS